MKALHIADLHIGKSIHGISLVDSGDQEYWVDRFLEVVKAEEPEVVMIAGDVYDRANPSGEAAGLLDKLLSGIASMNIPIMMVSGNHDSGKKLEFLSGILASRGIHIVGSLEKEIKPVVITGKDGEDTYFWLVPYIFPALVADKYDMEVADYQEAMKAVISRMDIDVTKRNVFIGHQNVTSNGTEVERGGSESMVAGVGQIDYSVFDKFDYVALGHIHSGYHIGRKSVRYAGTPICYHFDEIRNGDKGPVIVELGSKKSGECIVETSVKGIKPLHPMVEYDEDYAVVLEKIQNELPVDSYVKVVLSDRRVTPETSSVIRDMLAKKNSKLLDINSSYRETLKDVDIKSAEDIEDKSLGELFEDFFTERTSSDSLSDAQKKIYDTVEDYVPKERDERRKNIEDKVILELLEKILKED